MILFILSAITAILLAYYLIHRIAAGYSKKSTADLSDANYKLKRDIDISRKRAFQLQHSLQDVKESMNQLQLQRDSLLNQQHDLLNDRKENLKKWTDEVKN